jgi:hypothetical protein
MDQRTASNAICDACSRQYIESCVARDIYCTQWQAGHEAEVHVDEGSRSIGTVLLASSTTYIKVLVINN